ncbi:MAG: hypothetical protein FWC23_06215, partial [Chitinispirillia bacterium]|nr:hypothetical protein [Chitinispirillia bacterium]
EPVSAETAAHAASGGRRGPPPVADAAPVEAGPVVIEDGRTINFAQNLKEYRSPRLAMLLSLLVPGLGQAYSRNYVKAGGFVAAEVAVIGVAAYLNSVGKSKKRDAHKFADDHFDIDKLKAYETRLLHEFEERGIEDLTYYPYYHHEGGDFYGAAEGKQAYFYESIRNYIYAPGWKDNDPAIEVILSGADTITAGDGSSYIPFNPEMPAQFYLITRVVDKNGNSVFDGPLLGNSNNQVKYNSMVNDANSYHDAVNYMLYVLLVNHIGSAIDAGFTARAYNAKLLGNDGSVWNRLSVEQQYVFTGSEVSAGLALKVRF